MTRHYRLAGAAVVGVLLVAGCSDGAPVAEANVAPTSASPTASPSPSPSATAVVVAPQRPAEMADDGQVGAEAAAIYFLELDAYMQATGDTSEWDAMSHPECDFCAKRAAQAEEISSSGYLWSGGDLEVEVLRVYAQDPPTGIWPLDVRVRQSAAKLTDSDGTVASEIAEAVKEDRIEVAQRDGAWVIIELADIPSE